MTKKQNTTQAPRAKKNKSPAVKVVSKKKVSGKRTKPKSSPKQKVPSTKQITLDLETYILKALRIKFESELKVAEDETKMTAWCLKAKETLIECNKEDFVMSDFVSESVASNVCTRVLVDKIKKTHSEDCRLSRTEMQISTHNHTLQCLIDEMLHYVTLEDIRSGVVRLHQDQERLRTMYSEYFHHGNPDGNRPPQTGVHPCIRVPEETFDRKIDSKKCPRCLSTDTITIQMQKRSIDEPGSYFSQCVQCNHRWRVS